MDDTTPDERAARPRRGILLPGTAVLLLAVYFGAPMLVVAPFVHATGDVLRAVQVLFKPVEWTYRKCPPYAQYLDWQRDAVFGP